jgi:hypothetical protein
MFYFFRRGTLKSQVYKSKTSNSRPAATFVNYVYTYNIIMYIYMYYNYVYTCIIKITTIYVVSHTTYYDFDTCSPRTIGNNCCGNLDTPDV